MVPLFLRLFSARPLRGSVLFVLFWAAMARAANLEAATLTVTTTADSGAGSLRQVLLDAHDGDTVQFYPMLNGQTIGLSSDELAITKNITISGPGPNALAVSAAPFSRIFHIMAGHVVVIEGLTILGGNVSATSGGGIFNAQAVLTISNCIVRNNLSDQGTPAASSTRGR
jgi:hypothetical protein